MDPICMFSKALKADCFNGILNVLRKVVVQMP